MGRKRVARLMREQGLVARVRRRFRTTTDSKHASRSLRTSWRATSRRRRPTERGSPTSRSCGPQGWLYLAVILDLFSRRVVGWATSGTSTATWPSPRSTWRSRSGGRRRVWYITPIAAARTRARDYRKALEPAASRAA